MVIRKRILSWAEIAGRRRKEWSLTLFTKLKLIDDWLVILKTRSCKTPALPWYWIGTENVDWIGPFVIIVTWNLKMISVQ
jgi:hypothetical protein